MQCLQLSWNQNSIFGGIQTIQAFGVETQPQATGEKYQMKITRKIAALFLHVKGIESRV